MRGVAAAPVGWAALGAAAATGAALGWAAARGWGARPGGGRRGPGALARLAAALGLGGAQQPLGGGEGGEAGEVLARLGGGAGGRPGAGGLGGVVEGVAGLVGRTPLVRISSLSAATGCEILAKAEFLNPGGSVKDRVALQILREAAAGGRVRPGDWVCEGTAGSTGISLALLSRSAGLRSLVVMPDDAAEEKAEAVRAHGGEAVRVRPVSIAHPEHFVNRARRAAEERGGVFADQFENLANYRAHLQTGEEIWEQCGGSLDAFVCAAGTGGTVAGVSQALKGRDPRVRAFLIDPPGSSLYNRVQRGVMYTREEAEGKRLKNPFDTVTEGIGINRLTANFLQASVDAALRGTDQEAVDMARHLLQEDGLFVGSSSAMNCVGAVKVAQRLGPGHTIVTVLCDGGSRHLSKFHSPSYLEAAGLQWPRDGETFFSRNPGLSGEGPGD